MRLVLAILILGMVSVAVADVTVSNGMMTAEINSQSLQSVIQAVSSQTQVRISVDDSVRTSPVTASFQNLPIAVGIKKLLEGTGINYVVMGDASGQPESIYIGSSERPGAQGQKLDSRPVGNRSVTQPVYRPQQQYQAQPQPQPPQQPDPNRGNNQNPNEGRTVPPGVQKKMNGGAAPAQNATPTLPPTGGGLGTQQPQQQQPVQPEVKPAQQNQNPKTADDDDDDSDDEE